MVMDPDRLSQSTTGTKVKARQVLKKVVVPGNSRSSMSSSLSSVRDQSSEYDTPATSVAVTPAESLGRQDYQGRRSTKLRMNTASNIGAEESTRAKRKRTEQEALEEADARLAQVLQEAEYEERPAHSGSNKRGKRSRVEDSEDDEPISSSAPPPSSTTALSRSKKNDISLKRPLSPRVAYEEDSDVASDELMGGTMPKITKFQKAPSSLLPSRAARDSAKKALKVTQIQQVLDSEDSDLSEQLSDASMFASDAASDAFEESEDSDESVDEITDGLKNPSTAVAGPATVPAIQSTAAPRRRRLRTAPVVRAANRNRDRRRLTGLEDRVSPSFPCMCFGAIIDDRRRPESVQSSRKRIRKY